jgi:hypothetical protein
MILNLSGQSPDTMKSGKSSYYLNSLMFSFDYANNTSVLGNINTEVKQPSFSPAVATQPQG